MLCFLYGSNGISSNITCLILFCDKSGVILVLSSLVELYALRFAFGVVESFICWVLSVNSCGISY